MEDANSDLFFDNLEQEEVLLNYQQLAQRLGMTLSGVHKLVHKGEIPFLKVGKRSVRFIWRDVVEALKGDSYGTKNKVR